MPLSSTDQLQQDALKRELQDETDARKLEHLAAALMSRLLDVPIAIAKSGFQYGGDAGPAGRQGRRFRLECKKYGDTTSLSARELLGEIDHAIAHDGALEGWFLIATKAVSEQLTQELTQKGELLGVPVIIIDWRERELAPLAALCAFAPDLVDAEFSKEAGRLARVLQPAATSTIEELRRDLQSWTLGFKALRSKSHEKLKAIWSEPRASNADLGQDAAGGAQPKKVRRQSVYDALSTWWQGGALGDAPGAIVGADGVGKTWATLDWLVNQKTDHPIILVVPSSAAATLTGASEMAIRQFLAGRLYEVTGVRDVQHWTRRLDLLLKRPTSEGPVLTVWFDGLNQEPSVSWLSILKVLQNTPFAGRVRVMVTTRPHHFSDKLAALRALIVQPVEIKVNTYDNSTSGELDQMLAFEGLTQADLHPDLIEIARTPRLFRLVVKFRDRLVEAGQVTVHRLLWEYGRDTFGERAGKSFSEAEWRAWLQALAQRYRDGMTVFSLKALGEMATRPDLSAGETYQRLSDIIDGQFAITGSAGQAQLTPTVVAHALGAALLARLDDINAAAFEAAEAEVTQWFDPIAGLDQRAEILRAAVSILVERGGPMTTPTAGVLVTAWLQSQNVTDNHRREIVGLASHLSDGLLDAIEHSDTRTHASARIWAVNALRAIPRDDVAARAKITARARTWLSIVSRELDVHHNVSPEHEKQRAERYIRKLGQDSSGPITVLGVPIQLVDTETRALASVTISILEGFPLADLISCFEAAAVAQAVTQSSGWKGLKWLCYLNERDPEQTAKGLRALSDELRTRVPETGVHPGLPARAAALVLWLTGEEADEQNGISIDPGIDHHYTYENDYLNDPAHSFFGLERRHADLALSATDIALVMRIQRVSQFLADPRFSPPEAFVDELCAMASAFAFEGVNSGRNYTREDRIFENLELALAACAPNALAAFVQRKQQNISTGSPQSRYSRATNCIGHFLLTGQPEADAARALRFSASETDDMNEAFAAGHLLMLELTQLNTLEQFVTMVDAGLKFVSTDFSDVLKTPTPDEVDTLVARYGSGTTKQQHDLTILLSVHPIPFSDEAWTWFGKLARNEDCDLRGLVFRMLTQADPMRFGRMLAAEGWTWTPDACFWVNHFGSGALMLSETALPFEQIAPRLAPWRVLEAARLRGADAADVRFAAEIVGHILAARKLEEADPGADLSVERSNVQSKPFLLSAEPRQSPAESSDPIAALNANADELIESHRRAIDTAISRIDAARKAGASLYLTDLSAADMAPVVMQVSDVLDSWLDGCRDRTVDFRRRVRLAEGAYLALCEALLTHDPTRGVDLWRALRVTFTTRYIGDVGVDELLHIIFRAPDSAPVAQLRAELIELQNCHSDQALFELALVATYNKKADWLVSVIETDRISPFVWRRMRAAVLEAFTVGNKLMEESDWPTGWMRTNWEDFRQSSARLRGAEASARHWWRAYLTAKTPAEAYAAWVLFLAVADRRALIWMNEDVQMLEDQSAFYDHKLAHVRLNNSVLKRAMEKRPEKLDRKFLNQDPVSGIGPWGGQWD